MQGLEPASASPRHAVVKLPAEIDMVNAAELGEELASAVSGAATVIADLTLCTFCDTAGARMLLLAQRHAVEHGAQLRLVIPGGSARRVLQIMGLDRVLLIYASVDEAVSGRQSLPEYE